MATYTFEAVVRLPNGSTDKVRVQAKDQLNAKAMIEAQFGKGCIINVPSRV